MKRTALLLLALALLSLTLGNRVANLGSTTLALDEIGTSAYAAYGLRKLRAAYAGSAILVRESGGDTEAPIGFVNGELDTATLLTHCGANDGFVVTWYDQSGNSRDITRATTTQQPKIVTAGAVLVDAQSLPHVVLDGTDDVMTFSATLALPVFYSAVITISGHTDDDTIVTGGSTTRTVLKLDTGGGNNLQTNSGANLNSTVATVNGTQYYASAFFETGTNDRIKVNTTSDTGTAGDASVTALVIGSSTVCPAVSISELIWFAQDLGADEATLQANMNNRYTLY